jgi:hypothetical protein
VTTEGTNEMIKEVNKWNKWLIEWIEWDEKEVIDENFDFFRLFIEKVQCW